MFPHPPRCHRACGFHRTRRPPARTITFVSFPSLIRDAPAKGRNCTPKPLASCGPSPCGRFSPPQTTMATLTAAEDIGGFRGCFQPVTSALLNIPMPLSHVPTNGLKRDHVGGGFRINLSPLIAAPEWAQGISGSSVPSFWRPDDARSPRSVIRIPEFTLTHTRCPIGQGIETGVKFPVGRNPLRLDSPYDLSAKRGLLAACLAPHRYLSGACCSRRPNVRPRLAPTAHGVPVHPKEISLIPFMNFMAHLEDCIEGRTGKQQGVSHVPREGGRHGTLV